jgi:hypothetical protein
LVLLRRSLTKAVVSFPISLHCIEMRHQVGCLFFWGVLAYNFLTEILELPGNLQYSALEFWTPNQDQAASLPKRMAWLTGKSFIGVAYRHAWYFAGPGIYHGSLNFDTTAEDHIDGAALVPYPVLSGRDASEIPLSLSLTEFHIVLLYKDRITAICVLDDKTTYEETLPTVSSPLAFR